MMTIEDILHWFLLAVVLVPVVVLATYLSARAGAFAFFRTKREHLKQVLKDLKDGEN